MNKKPAETMINPKTMNLIGELAEKLKECSSTLRVYYLNYLKDKIK